MTLFHNTENRFATVLRVGTGQWRGLEQLSLWINTTFANGGIHTSRIHESRCLRMNDCSMFPSMDWSWIYVSMDWGIQDLMLDLFQQLRISISDCCLNSFCFGVPSSDQTLLSMWNTNLLHTSFSCFQRPLLSGAFDALQHFGSESSSSSTLAGNRKDELSLPYVTWHVLWQVFKLSQNKSITNTMSQFLLCAMIRQDDGDCVGDKSQLDPHDVTPLCCGGCCDGSSRRCCLCSEEEDWSVLLTIHQ